MPIIRTNAEIVVDAEELLRAVKSNSELFPNTEEHQAPLELSLERIKALRARQKTLQGDKQKVTQELKVAMRETRDLAIQLRAVVRAKIGVRSEKLVEFRIPPLRKRSRAGKPVEPGELGKKGDSKVPKPGA